ncbi:phage scaffolding protein [Pseudomonas gregormendelii]|uniref:phage scaffolding protein n=1 Tax=Pseudomonas gregormendelii TaxID=1628277 RepID=UPI001F321F6F|nr:phage scaffolding protein [Pseudomonas gregormendelii]
MSEPKVIYLGPACEAETGDGRTWAEDDPWPTCDCGHRPVRYVIGTDFDRVTAERDGLQLSLTTADQTIDDLQAAIARRNQRIEELVAEIANARQGPCKMIVGDELP